MENVKPYFNNAIITDITSDHLVLQVEQAERILHEVPYKPAPVHNNIDPLSTAEAFYQLATSSNPDQNLVEYCRPREENIEHFKDFIGGELYAEIKENKKGGGIRVKEISIIEPVSNLTYVTSYDYTNPNTGESSGVTTYVPFKINTFTLDYPEHYETSVEGYFVDGNLRDGGALANIIKNWQEITRTLLLGPALEHFLDYYDLIDHPDRKTMAAFLGLGLNTASETAEHRRAELMSELLSKVNEVPSANVMYEYVTVKNKVVRNGTTTDNQSYVVNQFSVYDASMVSIKADRQKLTTNLNTIDIRNLIKRGVTINNFGNAVGQIKSSRIHAQDGTLLSEKIYHYLHELNNASSDVLNNYAAKLNSYSSQGVLDEIYVNARYIPFDNDMVDNEEQGPGEDPLEEEEVFRHDLLGIMTKRRNLPMILLSVENKDYKTGITSIDKTLAFDFYSGAVTKNASTDGYGNTYLSEVIPAYELYPAMGLAVNGGKHMLTQQAASYSYQVEPNLNGYTKIGLVSASVQTWSNAIPMLNGNGVGYLENSNELNIWKNTSSYSWKGDDVKLNDNGLYPIGNFSAFNFSNGSGTQNSAQWQLNSTVTLTDVHSHALEAIDINGNYAATKMSIDNKRVFATIANAKYNEFAYSGMEDTPVNNLYGGGVIKSLGVENSVVAHTGKKSLSIDHGVKGCEAVIKTSSEKRNYHASIWVYDNGNAGNAKLTYRFGSNPVVDLDLQLANGKKAGDWYQFNVDFPVPPDDNLYDNVPSYYDLTVSLYNKGGSGAIVIDDFRVHPYDASMVSYVYNEWGELSHILDNNNLYTEYHYDAIGRLSETYIESFKSTYGNSRAVLVNRFNYQYREDLPKVKLMVSSSGPGAVVPDGPVEIYQGETIRLRIAESCPSRRFNQATIDGVVIRENATPVQLFDGTYVSLSGGYIIVKNVMSAHTIFGEFVPNLVPGQVVCNSIITSDGKVCYDGRYKYALNDACGQLGNWVNVGSIESIPAVLRPYIPSTDCCSKNPQPVPGDDGPVCACQIQPE